MWKKSSRAKAIRELRDSYVKYTIVRRTALRAREIPESLIKQKREQLLLRRLARHMKQELTKRSDT